MLATAIEKTRAREFFFSTLFFFGCAKICDMLRREFFGKGQP